jgi:hypothetical protein
MNRIASESNEVFPELATTFLFYISELHKTIVRHDIKKVYFLSREGQPLKRMFEMYLEGLGAHIQSHYLEVSRRSTLLPSLAPVEDESFETLFRQYRCISLLEFLSSLGLEAHTRIIADALGIPDGGVVTREKDFPTSQLFADLRTLPLFESLYNSGRIARRKAFIAYITELSGGTLPTNLAIVDVGWKGTIQDNLYKILCDKDDTPVREVTGYYIGLSSTGAARLGNYKYGLLFSSVGKASPRYYVFNENRALFEVVLAADHGSVVSYKLTADGRGHAIRGSFEEGEMLTEKVFPVQRQIFRRFEELVAAAVTPSGRSHLLSFKKVVRGHARMVFNPSQTERVWFSSVFHVENYGVFERSLFTEYKAGSGLGQRLRFLKQLVRQRDIGALGFWPWKTIYEQGGLLPATIYAAIRRFTC